MKCGAAEGPTGAAIEGTGNLYDIHNIGGSVGR